MEMNRITEKKNNVYFASVGVDEECMYYTVSADSEEEVVGKLGKLEDIEEECNIDIIKSVELCKKVNAQKKVYTKESWGIYELTFLDDLDVELFNHRLYKYSRGIYFDLDINEYGKYWALTREELENGR